MTYLIPPRPPGVYSERVFCFPIRLPGPVHPCTPILQNEPSPISGQFDRKCQVYYGSLLPKYTDYTGYVSLKWYVKVRKGEVYLSEVHPCTMSQTSLRLLLIEDNPGDAELVREMLSEVDSTAFGIDRAGALLPGLDRLAKGDIDVVLLDLSLPDSHGLDGLNAIRMHAPNVPVVLLTGFDNESLAFRAVQSGAQDYIVKGKTDGEALAKILRYAVVRQKTQAESAPVAASDRQSGRILGCLGVKGGVGTTTVACHLAMELKRRTGGSVLLIDLDVSANSIAFLMKLNGKYTVLDASNDILHLDVSRWEKMIVQGPAELDVIQSAGPVCQEEQLPKMERIRYVLRFIRSLYQWIVIDLGRLSPFSARLAEEMEQLFLVSAFDVVSLNEAKWTATRLGEAAFDRGRLALLLNQVPGRPCLTGQEIEKIVGVPVADMLPECSRDFKPAMAAGKPLGESRVFQEHVARLAARIAGLEEQTTEKKRLSFLTGVLRGVTTGF